LAPQAIARLSRQIGIASLNISEGILPRNLAEKIAEFVEFYVNPYLGPPPL
jgi:hypothetical protein